MATPPSEAAISDNDSSNLEDDDALHADADPKVGKDLEEEEARRMKCCESWFASNATWSAPS